MNIPKHAVRVFKGVIFSVYQWEQNMFDNSVATFEAIARTPSIQIIPTSGNTIFLSLEEQPLIKKSFTFLGGRLEENEDPLAAAKRELKEETGMTSSDWELFKIYTQQSKIQWDTYLYIARDCKKTTHTTLDSGEKIEVKAVLFEEFLDIMSDEQFWGQLIANDILRMRFDNRKLHLFKEKLFGK